MTRVAIPASDQTWLHMDRPNNLMYVHSLMWFEQPVEPGAVRQVLDERCVQRFPVFHRRPVQRNGSWFWEDDPSFDIDRHIRQVEVLGDERALKDHIGRRMAQPMDHEHPLWELELITGVEGLPAVMFARFHHALADGIRLTQLMLSMCDIGGEGDATPSNVGRPASRGLVGLVRRGVADAVDTALGIAKIPVRSVSLLGPSAFEQGWDLARHPGRVIDLVEALGSEDNSSVNTMSEVTRLLSAGRSVRTAWSGEPGIAKGVSWVSDIDLETVKQLGRSHGATVNDVLLALVSKAMTAYLREKDQLVDEIAWLVPVSLVPLDKNLPENLGNHFSLIFLTMPLGIDSVPELLGDIRRRMNRIKMSAEPIVSFGLQWVVAESPLVISRRITNLFANKGVGVLTNVPGPRTTMTFAGTPVAGSLGWAPTSGDQPLSVSLFSYDGSVNIGIAADARLVPDPDRIAELIHDEFLAMLATQ